jgi:AraC-like DNA-binding protein
MIDPSDAGVLNFSDVLAVGYREVPPPAALREFVECLWTAGADGADPVKEGRILPDGRMDLVWIRGGPVLVAGPQTRFTSRPNVRPLVAVGTRFHPGALPGLLRVPAAEVVDGHVALEDIDAGLDHRLDAALEAARTPGQAMRAFARELLRRVDALSRLDTAVTEATWLLADPRTKVRDVALEVYVSERQLRRRFDERVGYGPKTLQRVLRFQRMKAVLELPGAELARAAVAAGYSDQAHLTRECRELSGLTPAELVRWLRP